MRLSVEFTEASTTKSTFIAQVSPTVSQYYKCTRSIWKNFFKKHFVHTFFWKFYSRSRKYYTNIISINYGIQTNHSEMKLLAMLLIHLFLIPSFTCICENIFLNHDKQHIIKSLMKAMLPKFGSNYNRLLS